MVNAHRVFSSASLYKVWVMLEIYHQLEGGLLDLGEEYLVTDYYAGLGLNSGELAPCTVVTANHALGAMMSTSDNVAARMLLDRVGIGNLNSGLRTLGLHPSGFSENGPHVTARDMALVFEATSIGEMMNASAHQGMMSLLYTETIDNRLPALLPAGTLVAHKTGSRIDATHDAGVVVSPKATYVVVVLSDYGFSTAQGTSTPGQRATTAIVESVMSSSTCKTLPSNGDKSTAAPVDAAGLAASRASRVSREPASSARPHTR